MRVWLSCSTCIWTTMTSGLHYTSGCAWAIALSGSASCCLFGGYWLAATKEAKFFILLLYMLLGRHHAVDHELSGTLYVWGLFYLFAFVHLCLCSPPNSTFVSYKHQICDNDFRQWRSVMTSLQMIPRDRCWCRWGLLDWPGPEARCRIIFYCTLHFLSVQLSALSETNRLLLPFCICAVIFFVSHMWNY